MFDFSNNVLNKMSDNSDAFDKLLTIQKIVVIVVITAILGSIYPIYSNYYFGKCEKALAKGRIIDWYPPSDGLSSVIIIYEVDTKTFKAEVFTDGSKTRKDIGKKYWVHYCKEYPDWGYLRVFLLKTWIECVFSTKRTALKIRQHC